VIREEASSPDNERWGREVAHNDGEKLSKKRERKKEKKKIPEGGNY